MDIITSSCVFKKFKYDLGGLFFNCLAFATPYASQSWSHSKTHVFGTREFQLSFHSWHFMMFTKHVLAVSKLPVLVNWNMGVWLWVKLSRAPFNCLEKHSMKFVSTQPYFRHISTPPLHFIRTGNSNTTQALSKHYKM